MGTLIVQYQVVASERSMQDAVLKLIAGYRHLPLPVQVVDLNLPEGRLQLQFPFDVVEPGNIAQLLKVLMHEDIDFPVLLETLHLPKSFTLQHVKKNRQGVKGMRHLLQIMRRPLLFARLHPQSIRIESCLEESYLYFTHGIHLVIESPLITNFPRASFKERIEFLSKESQHWSAKIKRKPCYVPNITARTLFEMERRAIIARDHGVMAVTVNFPEIGWTALATVAELCHEQHLALFIEIPRMAFGHFELSSAVISSLASTLPVDAAFISARSSDLVPVIRNLQSEDPPIFPGILHLQSLEEGSNIIRSFGPDLIVEGGHLLSGHPEGLQSGAKALSEMLLA